MYSENMYLLLLFVQTLLLACAFALLYKQSTQGSRVENKPDISDNDPRVRKIALAVTKHYIRDIFGDIYFVRTIEGSYFETNVGYGVIIVDNFDRADGFGLCSDIMVLACAIPNSLDDYNIRMDKVKMLTDYLVKYL